MTQIQSARRAFREIPQNQVATLAIIELAEDPIDAENKKIPNVTVSNSNTEDTGNSSQSNCSSAEIFSSKKGDKAPKSNVPQDQNAKLSLEITRRKNKKYTMLFLTVQIP